MSTLRVDNLNARTGTKITVPTGTTLYAPGHTLQAVQNTYNVYTSTTSSSFVDTGLALTITPTSANSKVLLMVSLTGIYAGASGTYAAQQITRNGTPIINYDNISGYNNAGAGGSNASYAYLDSPNSTSALTYKIQIKRSTGSGTLYWNNFTSSSELANSSFIAMEVGA